MPPHRELGCGQGQITEGRTARCSCAYTAPPRRVCLRHSRSDHHVAQCRAPWLGPRRSAWTVEDALDAWARQVGRRHISITLAGGHMGICRVRTVCATTGSTGHRYRCSHCPSTEKNTSTPLPCQPIVKSLEQQRYEAKPPACVHATPEKKMRPHAPISSHRRPTGRFLGAGFDRRLLALQQTTEKSRPAGRLTCRV